MKRGLGEEVVRALLLSAAVSGISISVAISTQRDWASTLFEGTRFTLSVASEDAHFGNWLDSVPDADLPLRRHFVASAEVIERRDLKRATLELLAVED
jgi:hypothetical protein